MITQPDRDWETEAIRKKAEAEEQQRLRDRIKEQNAIRSKEVSDFEARQKALRSRRKARQREIEQEQKAAVRAKIEADLKVIRSSDKSLKERLDDEIEYLKEVQKRYKEGSAEFEKFRGRIAQAEARRREQSFGGGFLKGLTGGEGMGKTLGRLTGIGTAVQALRKTFQLLQRAITGSFKAAVDFEAQMAQLQAVTGINNEELDRLRKNVLDVAGSTKFTSEEIVQLQTELGKLGFSVPQIEAATLAVARTAQALGEQVGPVAQRIGQILNQFNLNAAETTRVAGSLGS